MISNPKRAVSTYDRALLDKLERAIRVLEVEAAMNEERAKRLAELASYINPSEHKLKLEALLAEAWDKASTASENSPDAEPFTQLNGSLVDLDFQACGFWCPCLHR